MNTQLHWHCFSQSLADFNKTVITSLDEASLGQAYSIVVVVISISSFSGQETSLRGGSLFYNHK
jgi:hypothetical protein